MKQATRSKKPLLFTFGMAAALGCAAVTIHTAYATPPSAPNLAVSLTNGKPDLAWTATTNTASYYIQRSTVSSGPYTIVGNVSNTTFRAIDYNATAGVRYFYVVTAVSPGATDFTNSNRVDIIPTS